MKEKNKESYQLRQGKAFHKKVQKNWLQNAEGEVKCEKLLIKSSGRIMDIYINSDNTLVTVVELKASNWDIMTNKAVHINVNKQAKQIWNYIESQLKLKKEVSPGIIFPKRPKNNDRMVLIERLFEEHGIPVVWDNESIKERKKRS